MSYGTLGYESDVTKSIQILNKVSSTETHIKQGYGFIG